MHPAIDDAKLARAKHLVGEYLVGLADVCLLAILLLLLFLLLIWRRHSHHIWGACKWRWSSAWAFESSHFSTGPAWTLVWSRSPNTSRWNHRRSGKWEANNFICISVFSKLTSTLNLKGLIWQVGSKSDLLGVLLERKWIYSIYFLQKSLLGRRRY